jgi:hypothetical protein
MVLMKGSTFSGITQCSQTKGSPACFVLVYSPAHSSILKTEEICSSETSVCFYGAHGVDSQKTGLFII